MPHDPRACAKENIRGELNTSKIFDALRGKSIDVSVWGCLKQNMVSRSQREIKKLMVGPGSGDYKAGYEASNFGELCVGWGLLVGR